VETSVVKHQRYLDGEFNLTDEVEKYLKRIKEHQDLNAFISVHEEESRQQALEIDKKRASGQKLGKLAGLIIAVKDNICVKDHLVTCGSHILDNFISPYHATAVEKILAEDGIIIGKTNLDEFAMGSSNENSYFGVVKNPLDPQRVPGGSSGGSAVAVATGMADLALGSETGGSVRQPASFCGVVGVKPTYGRVSRYGLVAFASSLDQIGTLGKTVADAAYLLGIIAGVDPHDSTTVPEPVPDYLKALTGKVEDMRIGIPKEYFEEGLDLEIKQNIFDIIERLRDSGIMVKEISLSLTDYAIATYYIIATAEASSNLARYDGVRYGLRTQNAQDLQEMYLKTRSEGFGKEVKRRIMLGTYVLSAGYYEAYYKKAQQVRRLIKEQYEAAFKEVDLLLTPTSPTPAFKLGEKIEDPLQMYLSDIYTVTANLAGICGVSIPSGKTKDGLPIGLQLIADKFQEDVMFRMADYIEKLNQNKT